MEEELYVQPVEPGKSFTVVLSRQDANLIASLNENLDRGFRASRLREWGYAYLKVVEKFGEYWEDELNGKSSLQDKLNRIEAKVREIISYLENSNVIITDRETGEEVKVKDIISIGLDF